MTHHSDEALFAAFQQLRDCHALGTLFHRRADELLRLAVLMAPRPSDAEDLVQATFLSAIAHADDFRAGSRVMSWLCGILTNHARMLRRASRRIPPPPPTATAQDPAETALHAELRQALAAGISGLPEPYRSVLTLHLDGGLDSVEISRRLARPPATIRKQIERALDRLRVILPIGLATGIAMQVNAQALAANAADAARFVGHDGNGAPGESLSRDGRPPGSSWLGSGSAVSLVSVAIGACIALLLTAYFALQPRSPAQAVVESGSRQTLGPMVVASPAVAFASEAGAEDQRRLGMEVADLIVRVLGQDGAAVEEFEVSLVPDNGKTLPERLMSGMASRAPSDRAGIARFSGLSPGDYELTYPGSTSRRRLSLSRGANDVTLDVPAPVAVRGVVVDGSQRPVVDAEIVASETSLRGDIGTVVARSRSDGSFAATVRLDNGRLFARHPSFRHSVGARLEPSTSLRLVLPPTGREVSVLVTDVRGRPLGDAYVAVVPRSAGLALLPVEHGRTDMEGRFRFRDPGPGAASVLACQDGFAANCADLGPEVTAVNLTMEPGRSLRGLVRDRGGEPLAGIRIWLSAIDQRSNEPVGALQMRTSRSDSTGAFVFENVPTGRVQLQAFGSGASARGVPFYPTLVASAEVTLGDGEDPEAVLTVVRGSFLSGRLVDAAGRPVPKHNVVAVPMAGTAIERSFRQRGAETGVDGSFSIDGLADGEDYSLGVYAPRGPNRDQAAFPLAVGRGRPGGEAVNLRLPERAPSRALLVRVLGPDGHPVRGASVELRNLAMQLPRATTVGVDGCARFGPLISGEYWLAVGDPSYGTRVVAVSVGNDPEDLDLGTITLEPPTQLIVQVHDLRGLGHRGLRVVARTLVGDKYVAAATDEVGLARLGPMPPGEIDVLVVGPGTQPLRRRVTARSGEERIEIRSEAAPTMRVRFQYSPADNPFVVNGPLHVKVESLDGALKFEEHVGSATARGCFDLAIGLPPGRYRIEARALWNAAGAAEIESKSTGDSAVVVIPLRR